MFKLEPCTAQLQYQYLSNVYRQLYPRRQHLAWDFWMCQEDPAGHWPKDAGASFLFRISATLACFSKFAQQFLDLLSFLPSSVRIIMIGTLAAHVMVVEVWHGGNRKWDMMYIDWGWWIEKVSPNEWYSHKCRTPLNEQKLIRSYELYVRNLFQPS